MKKLFVFFLTAFLLLQTYTMAQISAGIYQLSDGTYAAVGSDPDNKMFGEGRISAGSDVDVEGTFGYNFVQKDEVNFYSGFHLGIDDQGNDNDIYLGIPLGVLVKPFPSTRNFGFLLEASPIFPTGERNNYFRAGLGLKYTFR